VIIDELAQRARTTWEATANTLHQSALALCYSVAEYCAPVWAQSTYSRRTKETTHCWWWIHGLVVLFSTCKALRHGSHKFCRAMLCKCSLSRHAVSVCMSVRPSVTSVHSVEMNKHIYKIFSLSGSQAILVFFIPNGMAIFRREPPYGGVECRWGRLKSRFWACIWLHCMLLTLLPARCYQ